MPEDVAKRNANRRKRYAENREKFLAYLHKYRELHPEVHQDISSRYYGRNRAKVLKRTREYKKFHKDRHYAHFLIGAMVYFGLIVKPTHCENCGKERRLQGHHHKGYSKEYVLDIVWLCVPCHVKADAAMRDVLPELLPAL